MSDTKLDIERQKYQEYKEKEHWARESYCFRDCEEHNENCPYFDGNQEVWDYDECFRDKGW